jgi:hypothetical protein
MRACYAAKRRRCPLADGQQRAELARADNHHAPSAFTALALILILDVPAGPGVMC